MRKQKVKGPLFTILPPCAPLQPQEGERGAPRLQVIYWLLTTRAILGWSQKQLAEYLGVGAGAVYRWERRTNSMPADNFLVLLQLHKRASRVKRRINAMVDPQDVGRPWRREVDPVLQYKLS